MNRVPKRIIQHFNFIIGRRVGMSITPFLQQQKPNSQEDSRQHLWRIDSPGRPFVPWLVIYSLHKLSYLENQLRADIQGQIPSSHLQIVQNNVQSRMLVHVLACQIVSLFLREVTDRRLHMFVTDTLGTRLGAHLAVCNWHGIFGRRGRELGESQEGTW